MKTTTCSLKFFHATVATALAIVIAWGLSGQPAQAVPYVVKLQQVGPNVVATGSGAIDWSGLSDATNFGVEPPRIFPSFGPQIYTGPTPGSLTDLHEGFQITGPSSFGSGLLTFASSGSGDIVGIDPGAFFLFTPAGYVSDTPLLDSATYDNATFSSLGVTPGTYVWTWGTGPDQSFTLKIGTAAVPDSGSTFGLLLLALIALSGATRVGSLKSA